MRFERHAADLEFVRGHCGVSRVNIWARLKPIVRQRERVLTSGGLRGVR